MSPHAEEENYWGEILEKEPLLQAGQGRAGLF